MRLVVQLASGFYLAPEAWEYDTLARNMISGDGYVIEHDGTMHRAFTLPLYPLLLAAVYSVGGTSPVGVGLLQAVLGGVLAALTYAFAARVGRGVAILAAVGVATHPGLVVYSAKIHALNLDAVLAMTSALLARKAWRQPDVVRAIAAGALAGLAALERTTLAPAVALALASRGWSARGLRQATLLILVWGMVATLIVAPWVGRNAVTLGVPLMTTTSNEALWRGNNPHATGSNLAADGRPMLEAVPEMKVRVWGQPDVVQDSIFREAALDHMLSDPLATIGRTAAKLFFFWWFGPHAGQYYPGAWLTLYGIYYVGLVALAITGAVRIRRDVETFAAILLTAVPLSILQALYYVEGRHRWAIEPLLVVLAAAGVVAVVRRYRPREQR